MQNCIVVAHSKSNCRIEKGVKAVFKETESLSENTESYETSDNANKSWTETLIIRWQRECTALGHPSFDFSSDALNQSYLGPLDLVLLS